MALIKLLPNFENREINDKSALALIEKSHFVFQNTHFCSND